MITVWLALVTDTWPFNNISLESKIKLMRCLVISIYLYACESLALTAEPEKRKQAFEMGLDATDSY